MRTREENEFKKDGDHTLLVYLDDNGLRRRIFVTSTSLKVTSSFVQFRTAKNLLIIPWSRVIKLKQKRRGGNDE